jgi:hypothetical protein
LQRRQHCSVFNLLAGEPKRRPFSDSITALNAGPSPSGFVPGGGAGGRDVECFVFFGGEEGPDCILKLLFRVLVIGGGSIVIFFSSVVLYVTCKPTV